MNSFSEPIEYSDFAQGRVLNIILVEDDIAFRKIIVAGLRHFGHRLREVGNGSQLDQALADEPADVILLDLGLPDEDGYAIATRLRTWWRGGIIMLTGWSDLEQKVAGLHSGADLYLVKPVDIQELAASLQSLARRLPVSAAPTWRLLASASELQSPCGAVIHLTAPECIFLTLLFQQRGSNVARPVLFQALDFPDNRHGDLRLEALVSRLRAKIKAQSAAGPLPLRARTNRGYVLLDKDERKTGSR